MYSTIVSYVYRGDSGVHVRGAAGSGEGAEALGGWKAGAEEIDGH